MFNVEWFRIPLDSVRCEQMNSYKEACMFARRESVDFDGIIAVHNRNFHIGFEKGKLVLPLKDRLNA